MKLLQIVALLISGALVGTFVTNVWLRPHRRPMRAARAPVATPVPETKPLATASLASVAAPVPPATLVPAQQAHLPIRQVRKTARKPATFRRIQGTTKPRTIILAKMQPSASSVAPVSAPPPAIKSTQPTEVQNAVTPAANPSRPAPHQVTLYPGLLIPVRLINGLSTEKDRPGDTFVATIDHEIVVDGFVIVERGAPVEGRVIAADRGAARLSLELTRLHTADRQRVAIETANLERRPDPPPAAGETWTRGIRSAPASLSSETPLLFRLRTMILLTEKLATP